MVRRFKSRVATPSAMRSPPFENHEGWESRFRDRFRQGVGRPSCYVQKQGCPDYCLVASPLIMVGAPSVVLRT